MKFDKHFPTEKLKDYIKYSSSDKDVEQLGQVYKTTGRFCTGFMTTYLLSEKVQIESYYKDDTQTFNKFRFWIDRSGKGEKEIIQGVNDAEMLFSPPFTDIDTSGIMGVFDCERTGKIISFIDKISHNADVA